MRLHVGGNLGERERLHEDASRATRERRERADAVALRPDQYRAPAALGVAPGAEPGEQLARGTLRLVEGDEQRAPRAGEPRGERRERVFLRAHLRRDPALELGGREVAGRGVGHREAGGEPPQQEARKQRLAHPGRPADSDPGGRVHELRREVFAALLELRVAHVGGDVGAGAEGVGGGAHGVARRETPRPREGRGPLTAALRSRSSTRAGAPSKDGAGERSESGRRTMGTQAVSSNGPGTPEARGSANDGRRGGVP